MNEAGKITVSHRRRSAAIYVRQSTLAQVERNKESTARQYDLVARARQLGWPASAIRVIDGDLGVSGSVLGHRDAFDGLVAEVALGQVGIILALEVSRLVRDNAAWYRLLGAPRGAAYSCGDGRAPPPGRRSGPVEAGGSLSAPRGAVVYGWRWKTSISSPPQRWGEAGGSPSRGSPVRTGAASTKSRRLGTAG
jgi:resolvase-like protein